MDIIKHGLSVGMERVGTVCYVSIKASGLLTHEDYNVITPMLESAIAGVTGPKVRVLFDASEFRGWELRAAWDDFKVGLQHGNEFAKIAIYGNQHWQEWAAKIGSWFIAGEIKFFDDYDAALAWIGE
jgi:hypothetical protein